MDLQESRSSLARGGEAFRSLLTCFPEDAAHWKPIPTRWSVVEVVNHLYDEEKDDFRMRIALTLEDPEKPWPPIHPEAWCVERRYNERGLRESLESFLTERARSLAWLATLRDVDWTKAHRHPSGKELRAGDLIASWLAHDLLHLKQITRLLYDHVASEAMPFETDYAGEWN